MTILLLGFSLFYFLYYRQRSQAYVYVGVNLIRPQGLATNVPPFWSPYWVDLAIEKNDREVSPLGGVNTIVINKESADSYFYGKFIYLLLQIRAVKDRTGVYLFKNKPLLVGSYLDLKLTKTQVQGLVSYVGLKPPESIYKKLILAVKARLQEPWVAEAVEKGETISDSTGKTLVKVLGKKVNFSEVRVDSALGQAVLSFDPTKKDMELILEMLVKKVEDAYYFAETQKIKANEILYLPFKKLSLNAPVTAILEVKEAD